MLKLYTAMEDEQAVYLVFGLEIESKVHYAMPVDKFNTGIGAALQFIKHQHDDNMNWIINQKHLEKIDHATVEFIQTATGTDFNIDENEEVIDMCRAWKNSMDQAKSEGINEGRKEGRMEGQRAAQLTSIRNLMQNKGWTDQEAMDALMISTDEQAQYISMI